MHIHHPYLSQWLVMVITFNILDVLYCLDALYHPGEYSVFVI